MRLLLASYYYPPSIGGVEQQSHLLARELVRRGHHVHVVTARQEGYAAREVLDGVTIERVSPGRGSRWSKMATYLWQMLAATARARGHTDVIQVQQALYPAAAMAAAAELLGRPLVVRNAGSGVAGAIQLMGRLPFGALGLRLVARRATVVSLSDEMTAELAGAGMARVVSIPNGVALPPETTSERRAAARARLGLSGRVALYVGRFEAEKGVDRLIDAWRRVELEDATLVLVGGGPERARLERACAEHPSGTRIRFCEATSDVSPFREAADLFVLASPSEGISNALLEAMASGLPALATAVGGNRQVIERPELGTLVPPGDTAALGAAMRAHLLDPERGLALGRAARAHVAARFSVDAMVGAYERLYANLMTAR